MHKIETGIPGLWIIETKIFSDHRGEFFESYHRGKLAALGIDDVLEQVNVGRSRPGTIRGLHFQRPPHAQSKLVRCSRGSLYDAVVDLRKGSPTYGKWFGTELTERDGRMLYVPAGFAHGFYAITACELTYNVGMAGWNASAEGGLRWNDEAIGIAWPVEREIVINERDGAYPSLAELDSPFVYETADARAI
jgi:dTDP-4-dehydrorhamnose 3,5-epimerase